MTRRKEASPCGHWDARRHGPVAAGDRRPLLWAQATGPITVTACAPCHGGGRGGAAGGTDLSHAGRPACRLPGQAAARVQVRQAEEPHHGSPDCGPEEAADFRDGHTFRQSDAGAGHVRIQSWRPAGKVLYEEGNRATGVPACVGCHLPDGAGSERYPRLAGQRQAYIVQQLTEFKSGTRTNDRAHVMRALAGRLTDEEIRAVAEYLAGL